MKPNPNDTKCKECNGTGKYWNEFYRKELPCPMCGTGTSKEVVGEWPKKKPECSGNGMAEDYYWDGYNQAIDDCLLAHNKIVAEIAEQREHELAEKDKEIARLREALEWAFKAGEFDKIAWDNHDQPLYEIAKSVLERK